MKLFYTQLDRRNPPAEGYFKHGIYDEIGRHCKWVNSLDAADLAVIFYAYSPGYEFDETLFQQLRGSGKPIVVFDFIEVGQQEMRAGQYLKTYQILGYRYEAASCNPLTPEYAKLAAALLGAKTQICLYFKRELSANLSFVDCPFAVLPIEFPVRFDDYSPVCEADYYARPHDIYFNYGLSSIDRFRLHGKLLMEADRIGHNIIQTEKMEEHFLRTGRHRNVVIFHREWLERVPYAVHNVRTRTTIDLYGAGMKCFRTTEGTINSLSFKQDPCKVLWAYPWVDGKNCIALPVGADNRLDVDAAYEVIHEYIRGGSQHRLYELYLGSVATNLCYSLVRYVRDYILPNIHKQLARTQKSQ